MKIEKGQVYKVKNQKYFYFIDSVSETFVSFHYIGSIITIPKSENLKIQVFEWMINKGEISLDN